MQNTKKIFVEKASLSGYRSIYDLSVLFNKDLNIIIGKNSAGKTNFLTFLKRTLSFDFAGLNNFSSHVFVSNGIDKFDYRVYKKIESINKETLKSQLNLELKDNEEDVIIEPSKFDEFLTKRDYLFNANFICHGIPSSYKIVDEPYTYSFEKDLIISGDVYPDIISKSSTTFLKNILLFLISLKLGKNNDLFSLTQDEIKIKFREDLRFIEEIRDTLITYTPIKDIRFSDNFNVYYPENGDKISIDNLFLEFKINNDWLPFKFLSDGTKRTFFLISELFEFNNSSIAYSNSSFRIFSDKISNIFLIEEPELGIHPHQFKKILDYIKMKSRQAQVFITTHSPQSLDILDEDELDKILITFADSKNNTKMRQLSFEEKTKAKAYISEDFLSDYWLYSDLES